MEHRLSALLQLHLHSWLNTYFQWIRQRERQDEAKNIKFWKLVRFILKVLRYLFFFLYQLKTMLYCVQKPTTFSFSSSDGSDKQYAYISKWIIIKLCWIVQEIWRFSQISRHLESTIMGLDRHALTSQFIINYMIHGCHPSLYFPGVLQHNAPASGKCHRRLYAFNFL